MMLLGMSVAIWLAICVAAILYHAPEVADWWRRRPSWSRTKAIGELYQHHEGKAK